MEGLVDTVVQIINNQLKPPLQLDSTTVAYIQYLVGPYASAIEAAPSLESLNQWIDLVYPSTLAQRAHDWSNDHELPQAMIDTLTVLVDAILEAAFDNLPEEGRLVLPWHLQAVLADDEALQALLQVATDSTLPVSVTINGQTFDHAMTEEYVAGIQEYYWHVMDTEVDLSLFGTFLETEYLTELNSYYQPGTEAMYVNRPRWRVTFTSLDGESVDRAFNSLDYLTGAATAAQWLGQDYHTYMSNLRHINPDGTVGPKTF